MMKVEHVFLKYIHSIVVFEYSVEEIFQQVRKKVRQRAYRKYYDIQNSTTNRKDHIKNKTFKTSIILTITFIPITA